MSASASRKWNYNMFIVCWDESRDPNRAPASFKPSAFQLALHLGQQRITAPRQEPGVSATGHEGEALAHQLGRQRASQADTEAFARNHRRLVRW